VLRTNCSDPRGSHKQQGSPDIESCGGVQQAIIKYRVSRHVCCAFLIRTLQNEADHGTAVTIFGPMAGRRCSDRQCTNGRRFPGVQSDRPAAKSSRTILRGQNETAAERKARPDSSR
jgi:hypothetical protein